MCNITVYVKQHVSSYCVQCSMCNTAVCNEAITVVITVAITVAITVYVKQHV